MVFGKYQKMLKNHKIEDINQEKGLVYCYHISRVQYERFRNSCSYTKTHKNTP